MLEPFGPSLRRDFFKMDRLYKAILTYKRQTRLFSVTPLSQDIPFDHDLARLFKAKKQLLARLYVTFSMFHGLLISTADE